MRVYDVHGALVTGLCHYYPGGSNETLFYSNLAMDDPDAFEVRYPMPGSVDTWRLTFRDATTSRDGRNVTVESFNVRAPALDQSPVRAPG